MIEPSLIHCLSEISITMPVVEASISDICASVKLIHGWRLISVIFPIFISIEHHPVSTINELKPLSFLILSRWLECLSLWLLCGAFCFFSINFWCLIATFTTVFT
jgi:hypothetical protein